MRENDVSFAEVKDKRSTLLDALDKEVSLKSFSELYMEYVLATCGGNKVHAARILGIDRRTIQRLVKTRNKGNGV